MGEVKGERGNMFVIIIIMIVCIIIIIFGKYTLTVF